MTNLLGGGHLTFERRRRREEKNLGEMSQSSPDFVSVGLSFEVWIFSKGLYVALLCHYLGYLCGSLSSNAFELQRPFFFSV